MTGIAGTQVYSIIHSCNISWEEATLRRKALPLLMEWDAACPHTQVNAMLQLSCCLTRHVIVAYFYWMYSGNCLCVSLAFAEYPSRYGILIVLLATHGPDRQSHGSCSEDSCSCLRVNFRVPDAVGVAPQDFC